MNGLSKQKKLLFLGATVLIAFVLAGALLEGVLRLGLLDNPQYHRQRIQGKAEGAKHRLLILGDSFMLKYTLLGELLAENLEAHDVAVSNVAISGSGPFEYLAELKAHAETFKPDVVLLTYYAGNDLTNVQNHPRFQTPNGMDRLTGLSIDSNSSRRFFRHFYLYHYLLARVRQLLMAAFNYEELEEAGIPSDLIEAAKRHEINPWLLKLRTHESNHLLDNILMETDENMRAWAKVRELLTELHEVCQDNGSQLLMVIFPRSIQVNRSHFAFYQRTGFNLDGRTLETSKPQALLKQLCEERNIPCLDILPVLRARRDEEFYRTRDDHLNERGNRLVEKLILNHLIENTGF